MSASCSAVDAEGVRTGEGGLAAADAMFDRSEYITGPMATKTIGISVRVSYKVGVGLTSRGRGCRRREALNI